MWIARLGRLRAERRVASRKVSVALGLLSLEDRTMPSTFTVLNLDDDGPGSLRQAISDARTAPGADVIEFQAGLSGTIGLTSGPLSIADDVTVKGPGAGVIAISGNDLLQVIAVSDAAAHVVLSDLSIVHGRASRGGGLLLLAGEV